jgi:hypothetical protein
VPDEREENEGPNGDSGACQQKEGGGKLNPAGHELAYFELAI